MKKILILFIGYSSLLSGMSQIQPRSLKKQPQMNLSFILNKEVRNAEIVREEPPKSAMMERMYYVCAFPGCGKIFNHPRALWFHNKVIHYSRICYAPKFRRVIESYFSH